MNIERCEREDELLDALGRQFIGPELAAHVGSCSPCSELHLVAGALLDERVQATIEAPIPSAGTMWWRMQMRHRQELQSTARRSLLIGQAATLAIAMGLMVFLFGDHLTGGVSDVIASIRIATPLMLALATCLLLVPVAGYVAIRQK